MIPSITASAILAATIRHCLATITFTALTPPAQRSVTTARSNQIGMAPGAKWIGCRNMDVGTGTPARYIECMQWFLAPYPIGGGQGDPTKAPDITINSWGCPTSEGCSPNTLQAAVDAQAAAGIMMVVAAGNSGSVVPL